MTASKVWVVDNQYGNRELGTITKLCWLVVTLPALSAVVEAARALL